MNWKKKKKKNSSIHCQFEKANVVSCCCKTIQSKNRQMIRDHTLNSVGNDKICVKKSIYKKLFKN